MSTSGQKSSRANRAPPPRKTYRHGDLRRALLEAGIELARFGGPDAVVLREATRRAGVVPNAAYRHFASRQDLLAAVRSASIAKLALAKRFLVIAGDGESEIRRMYDAPAFAA